MVFEVEAIYLSTVLTKDVQLILLGMYRPSKLFDSLQIELTLRARPRAIQINTSTTLNSHTSLVALAMEGKSGTTLVEQARKHQHTF